jgi:hypothetical protein
MTSFSMREAVQYPIVLQHLRLQGGTGNVMEALGWSAARFDEGFALTIRLQNENLLKLLYSNYNKNLIVAELTLPGRENGDEG